MGFRYLLRRILSCLCNKLKSLQKVTYLSTEYLDSSFWLKLWPINRILVWHSSSIQTCVYRKDERSRHYRRIGLNYESKYWPVDYTSPKESFCQGIIHLIRTQNFSVKLTFLNHWYAQLRVHITSEEMLVFRKIWVRTKWMIPNANSQWASSCLTFSFYLYSLVLFSIGERINILYYYVCY